MEIESLIDFGGTAEWRRRKFQEYPSDLRNRNAADILDRLGCELVSFEGSEIHKLLEAAIELTSEDGFSETSETISEHLRSVGFWSFPDNAADFILSLVRELSS